MAGPLTEAPVEEPIFRITEIVEPSSSDAVSSDPSANDRGVVLTWGYVPNLVEDEDGVADEVPVRVAIPEGNLLENPHSDTSSPLSEEDITHTCFDFPPEPSPLNPHRCMGDT